MMLPNRLLRDRVLPQACVTINQTIGWRDVGA